VTARRPPAAAAEPDPAAFPAPEHLDPEAAKVWAEVIGQHHEPAKIAGPDLEAYCGQVAMLRDARARVAAEGAIIEDERGRPDVHPAIALERLAQKEIREWGDKFRGRTRRPEPRGRG
jgi:phage terminase small subunit